MTQRKTWGQLSLSPSQDVPSELPELSLRRRQLGELAGVFRWSVLAVEDIWSAHRRQQSWPCFGMLAVVAAHIALIWWALYEIEPPLSKVEPPPMTVSLITLPAEKTAPEPEIVPIIKQKPVEKPVIKPKETPVQKVVERPAPVVERIVEPAADTPRFEASAQAAPPPLAAPEAAAPAKVAATPVAPPKHEVEEKEEPPKFGVAYLNNPAPEYPRLAKRAGEQGRVLLKVLVNADGLPGSVEVSKGSGFERLDNAALEAVKQWRFEPARKGGKAISAYVIVPLSFTLN
ncbi:energy transducer TonB [Methylophilus aquaticus]|uniref:Protein TonB n=1 Tax=Methylophilus aquaticus TaxID=1971610 RepID=A0ABT9JQ57_9PROT|nr:energy transducer TonB [Methylophilus aquaticus]MDP8566686.1 energy transducer TonB [Methylophilus aquaticus]